MRIFLAIFILLNLAFSADIKEPAMSISTQAKTSGMSLIEGKLYIATIDGSVEIYDINEAKFDEPVRLKSVKNSASSEARPSVLNVDVINGKMLVLAEGDDFSKVVYVKNGDEMKAYDMPSQSIKRAFFIDEDNIVFASFSNEIFFLNLSSGKITEQFKIAIAFLADMRLSEDRKVLAIAVESGKIYYYDVMGKKMSDIIEAHRDTMYNIDFKNGVVATSGVDKSIAILQNGEVKRLRDQNLIFSVALSPNAKTAAFTQEDLSVVHLFDVGGLEEFLQIKTPQTTINSVVFIDEDTIATSAFDKKIYFWKIR